MKNVAVMIVGFLVMNAIAASLVSEELMSQVQTKGADVPKDNYYTEVATLFGDLAQVSALHDKEIKVTCFNIVDAADSRIYTFSTSLNKTLTVAVGNNYYINNINDIKAPVPLLKETAENVEWIELSKLYFNMGITKISFLDFANMEIAEKTTLDFIFENIDDSSFFISCPLSKRKRIVRYSFSNLLQLRDYDGEKLLQEINFTPETTSIYRMYIIGEVEVTFFNDGGIKSLIEYDNDSQKAVRGREWSKGGVLLGERNFIKNPINYNEIKIQK